jgi:hypothetical protein
MNSASISRDPSRFNGAKYLWDESSPKSDGQDNTEFECTLAEHPRCSLLLRRKFIQKLQNLEPTEIILVPAKICFQLTEIEGATL